MQGHVHASFDGADTLKLEITCCAPSRVYKCWAQVGTCAAHCKQLAEAASSMSSCGAGGGSLIVGGQRVQDVDQSRC